MSEREVPKTRLCKCGKPASVIKDYWVSEFNSNRVRDNNTFDARSEYVCGILRRRFCPECLSKLALHQMKVNRRLNITILISIFVPFAIAAARLAFDLLVLNNSKALVPFVLTAAFTIAAEGFTAYKLGASQIRRKRIRGGEALDISSVEELIDSLNFGMEEAKKIKDIPSIDIVSDGEGRVNYNMERSGFNMRIMLDGRISIEPMTRRIKYPFDDNSEYVKRTYVNAGLLEDNIGFKAERLSYGNKESLSEV